jgi:hypothetical protein
MRKLNELQKEMIVRNFARLGLTIIKYVEKYGNDKETLETDTQLAYDIIQERK